MLHNPSMEEILRKNGLLVRNIVDIDIFDYLVQPEKITKTSQGNFLVKLFMPVIYKIRVY